MVYKYAYGVLLILRWLVSPLHVHLIYHRLWYNFAGFINTFPNFSCSLLKLFHTLCHFLVLHLHNWLFNLSFLSNYFALIFDSIYFQFIFLLRQNGSFKISSLNLVSYLAINESSFPTSTHLKPFVLTSCYCIWLTQSG